MGNRKEATSVVTSILTGLIYDNFNENGENVSGSEVSGSDSDASERVTLDGLNMDGIEVDELSDSDDSGRLDSAHGFDSDGQNWPEFNLENDMSNPRLKVGMLFKSKHSLKEAAKQYGAHKAQYEKIYEYLLEKKEEANKWKGTLCPKIKKKLDINIKDLLRCVPSHAGGDKYQVECNPGSQHVVDLVQNSCSCRNWDLTSIPCMYALAVIDASLSNMLPILPPPLRRPPGRPTKVRRKELDEPQTTERLSKRGVEMRYSKCKIIGHNKRSCKGEVGQNIPVKRHQVGDQTQQQATLSQQEGTPTQ
ncbi:hypothetical protein PVK06_035085 [Gossypium arboreum]|uniref:SWIM-type domain-containing protein n=1 Tax=Gossypium arboreum TaxID=29729 RepID=A0ABR0NI18_GOSAR|nr:hypothetical protein PVK06_035085 [Gossypium arboreum]